MPDGSFTTGQRYRLDIEYDGTPFHGWQKQTDRVSVQTVLEAAIERFAGHRAEIVGAGRTDAGVHALGQVAHVDLAKALPPDRVRAATNAHLRGWPVVVTAAARVDADFHARFDAVERCYRYVILNRRAPGALERGRSWHVPVRLDGERMHAAAQALVGRHDFTSFRASDCQASSPVRTLDRLYVLQRGERVLICARARSFLHHQVRNMVGTLKLIGEGKAAIELAAEALAARNRSAAGETAPACGLYLDYVHYGERPVRRSA